MWPQGRKYLFRIPFGGHGIVWKRLKIVPHFFLLLVMFGQKRSPNLSKNGFLFIIHRNTPFLLVRGLVFVIAPDYLQYLQANWSREQVQRGIFESFFLPKQVPVPVTYHIVHTLHKVNPDIFQFLLQFHAYIF